MTTAQVETWVAAHKGSIDDLSRHVAASPADAAVAGMMLHRRRAAVAEVLAEFRTGVGIHCAPSDGRAPRDGDKELAAAAAAGEVVAGICAAAPPLLFERALLAEMQGRNAAALADLEQLLDSYPGFLAAAIVAARLALAAGEPDRAVRALAYVEKELTLTREGSALLADALRAVGLYETASSYDLSALLSSGHNDSHGNDCAPVDVMGNVTRDRRMPPLAFAAERRAPGHVLCNDRGIYYVGSSILGVLLLDVVSREHLISTARWLAPPARAAADRPTGVVRANTIRLSVAARKLLAAGSRILPAPAAAALSAPARRILARLGRWGKGLVFRLMTMLYRRRRGWPSRVLALLNARLPPAMRIWEWDLAEITERDRRSPIARERLQFGVARIFRTAAAPAGSAGAPPVPSAPLPGPAAAIFSQLASESASAAPPAAAADR